MTQYEYIHVAKPIRVYSGGEVQGKQRPTNVAEGQYTSLNVYHHNTKFICLLYTSDAADE